jgi:serine/threonine protein kinase
MAKKKTGYKQQYFNRHRETAVGRILGAKPNSRAKNVEQLLGRWYRRDLRAGHVVGAHDYNGGEPTTPNSHEDDGPRDAEPPEVEAKPRDEPGAGDKAEEDAGGRSTRRTRDRGKEAGDKREGGKEPQKVQHDRNLRPHATRGTEPPNVPTSTSGVYDPGDDEAATGSKQDKGKRKADPTPAGQQSTQKKIKQGPKKAAKLRHEDKITGVSELQQEKALATIPKTPEGTLWQAGQALGKGGHGSVTIWFLPDQHGRILRRIVVKDCYVPPMFWCQIHHWVGDPRGGPEGKQHAEIEAMERYRNKPGNGRLVRLIHHERNDEQRSYRLYLNYCPHRDLNSLIDHYKPPENYPYVPEEDTIQSEKACDGYNQGGPECIREHIHRAPPAAAGDRRKEFGIDENAVNERRTKPGTSERFIPEPFLWWVFQCLVEACLVMETGSVEEEASESDWPDVIVHRDLKPLNIFLDSPDDTQFPSYPQPRVGDFGIAILTNREDGLNPHAYKAGACTPEYQAPEMLPLFDISERPPPLPEPMEDRQLLGPTNIWGIGTIMTALLSRCEACYGADYKPDTGKDIAKMQPIISLLAQKIYSKELRNLVLRCTRFAPIDRVTARDALREIMQRTAGTSSEQPDLAEGMRNMKPKAKGARDHVLGGWDEGENYRLGMAMPEASTPTREAMKDIGAGEEGRD